jgi:hypothetical protein
MVEKLASRVIGFVVLLAFSVVMSIASDAWAGEMEDHGRYVVEKTEVRAVKVGDVDGHVVGSYHNTGVAFWGKEITTSFGGGTFDFVNQVGPVRGFTVDVFKDGSTITSRGEGEAKLDENKKQYFEGAYQCISGTGRWKGIQCKGTWKQSSEANGMGVGEWRGTLTLPD